MCLSVYSNGGTGETGPVGAVVFKDFTVFSMEVYMSLIQCYL